MGCESNPVSLSAKFHDQAAVMMRSTGILVSRLYKKTIETAASDPSDSYAQAATSDNDSEITRNDVHVPNSVFGCRKNINFVNAW